MFKDDDTNLVRSCLDGDVRAFENLVEKYQRPVFNVIYRMCHDYEDARDLTQGVFVRVYERLESYNPKFRFFSWIYRIAINESINHINQKKTMNEIPENYQTDEYTPEDSLEQHEITEQIRDSLNRIDPKYRALIVLKHFQNCSYQQISQIMKIPEKTVKSRLFIARQQLGRVLMQRGII